MIRLRVFCIAVVGSGLGLASCSGEGDAPSIPKSFAVGDLIIDDLTKTVADPITARLHRFLKDAAVSDRAQVAISLATPTEVAPHQSSGSVDMATGDPPLIILDGVRVTAAQLRDADAKYASELAGQRRIRIGHRRSMIATLLARIGYTRSARELDDMANTEQQILLTLSAAQIADLTNHSSDVIAAVDLYEGNTDDSLATAQAATSTNALSPSVRGAGIGIFMTESGCAPSGFVANYTRLSGSDTDHSKNVVSILRAVSPDSAIYCKGGAALPSFYELSLLNPRIALVTRSNGSTQTSDYDGLTRDWDDWVYNNRIPIMKSAGNNGNDTGVLSTPGAALNLTTVGNYNDSFMGINPSSSYVDPVTKNAKPELSAPGTDIDAGGFTFTGTSQATPFVAAIAADIMSSKTWQIGRPHNVKATSLATSSDSISGGFDKVGVGGIDIMSATNNMTEFWWEGSNASFASYAANDGGADSTTVEVTFSMPTPFARVALVWLNRGTYTYAHKGNSTTIGMDLDLRIYGPGGQLLAGSWSTNTPFEVVSFNNVGSGTYKAVINRFSNSDTSCNLAMALAITRL